jgi:Raf kinase inhibitor-like YbhB/YbcL family protein
VHARLSLLLAGVVLAGCGGGEKAKEPLPAPKGRLALESGAFSGGGRIPRRYTCDGPGDGLSPPLSWSGVPRGAKELALEVDDRDAPGFVHWTVLRISPRTARIPEGRLPPGAVETRNSFGHRGYGGPCPPRGDRAHRYVFALYTLDRHLGLGANASPDDVRSKLAAASTARGTLTGRYGR